MNCTECKNLIEKYLEGAIEASELEALKGHARDCPECRAEFESVGNVEILLKDALAGGIVAEQGRNNVLSEIMSGNVKMDKTSFGPASPIAKWASIAAMIALVVGILIGFALSEAADTIRYSANKVPMEIGDLEGTVLVKHRDSKVWEQLQPQGGVYQGDVFHSAAKSGFVLTFEDGSTMKLSPNSTLSLKLYNGGTEFYLEHGVLAAALNSPHPSFVVGTPHGRVEALGTEFTVSVE
jgi:hypothetical protein